ncbi:hypothetical protein PMG71_11605 [Roseofilum sp. BLCC_M154]|uniref:Addiction module component n=1 Tax=Roseofilum acuticapitatum BLCC-M154 TaxID=3022444 RepID=A0ABT7AUH5_9CYAN|nr:hypothetical protein [Roseofilum acuticapitatum]MDJ1170074.1 hypothetical protein [Roseofilum acuticapitatum BLCC-M154]
MSLQEVKQQVVKLSVRERLSLVSFIIDSLPESRSSTAERSKAIEQMRGLLKTDKPAPTDEEVEAMLEERRINKYL